MTDIENAETHAMNNNEIGAGIVAISRKARFADTSVEEWGDRITALIRAQPEVRGSVEVSNVHQVGTAAGGSNGTLLFDVSYETDEGLQLRHLVLRFLPAQGLFHRYDVSAQFGIQKALETSDVPVPPQLWLDAEGTYLERPGYIMGQVAGVSTPMAWLTSGLLAEASAEDRRALTTGYVHALAKLHNVDWQSAGLQWLEKRASGARPIEREVNWYWDALKWANNEAYIAQLEPVRNWLIANEPNDVSTVLCHGDANLGNYMFEETKVTAVVDWEMAFLGAPECDLSFLKIGDSILNSEVPWPEGALTHDEMRQEYERVSGRTLKHMEYFELFSSFRLAVINVLAMKHFPAEVLASFMPILKRGPDLCLQRARALNAID